MVLTHERPEAVPLMSACEALAIHRSTFYARRRRDAQERPACRARQGVYQPRALTDEERQRVREILNGEDATKTITAAKLFTLNVTQQVASQCMQLSGGAGYMKESMAGRAFVDTRIHTIAGGSDETMLHYLAKQLGF